MTYKRNDERSKEILEQTDMSWEDLANYTMVMFMDDAIKRLQWLGDMPETTNREMMDLIDFVADQAEDKLYKPVKGQMPDYYANYLKEFDMTPEEVSNGFTGMDLYFRIDDLVGGGVLPPMDHLFQMELVNAIDGYHGYDLNGERMG